MKISSILYFFSFILIIISLKFGNSNNYLNCSDKTKILLVPEDYQESPVPKDDIYSSLFNEPTDYIKLFGKKETSENNWISQIN